MRRAVIALLLVQSASLARGQAVMDPELAAGIQLIEEGDFEGAILALDRLTRRLGTQKAPASQQAPAFLHLGVAYAREGQDERARASFRAALASDKDLTMDPTRYPAKVAELFRSAGGELRAPREGGRSKTPLIIGGVAVAGGGVALATRGGQSAEPPSPQPSATPPADTRRLNTSPLIVSRCVNCSFPSNSFGFTAVSFRAAGVLEGRAQFPAQVGVLRVDLVEGQAGNVCTPIRMLGEQSGRGSVTVSASVSPGNYCFRFWGNELSADAPVVFTYLLP